MLPEISVEVVEESIIKQGVWIKNRHTEEFALFKTTILTEPRLMLSK